MNEGMRDSLEFVKRHRMERKAKAPSVRRKARMKIVYFYDGDETMDRVYDALCVISPSRGVGGPNVSAYLRSHADQIVAEAEAKR